MLKCYTQIVHVHLQPFRRNPLLKCVLQPEIAKKITKNFYFGGTKSLKVIHVDSNKSLSLLLVMISNRFHTTRDNCGKITAF